MFLATTGLTEFWDTKDEVLFLGRWCMRHDRRPCWKGLRGQLLDDQWADRQRLVHAFQYCTEVFERALVQLTGYLNTVHGTKYSERYWRVILGAWLLEYIQILYDRYLHVRAALEVDDRLSTICLDPSCYVTPKHFSDFAFWYVDDPYNLQLYSQIFRLLEREMPLKKWAAGMAPRPVITGLKGEGQHRRLRRLVNHAVALAAPEFVMTDIDISGHDLLKAIWLSKGSVLPMIADVREPKSYGLAEAVRSGFQGCKADGEFEAVLYKSLPVNFPTLYLEGYQTFRHRCLPVWCPSPKAAISSNGWYANEAFKFRAAEWSEHGTSLLSLQHGGGYGSGRVVPLEWFERSIVDRFFTWGWAKSENDSRLNDLPHPRFCRFFKRSRKQAVSSPEMLFVTSAFPRYPGRFQTVPIGNQVDQYLDDRAVFLENLSGRSREETFVRLHPTDYPGSGAREQLQERCPDIKVDNMAMSCANRLERCRVAIFDNPGTAYLEGFALNVPSILFWRPESFEERPSSRPYFESLRKALILHDDPKAAAVHASAIYGDPWSWWGSQTVQTVRRQFLNRFVLTDTDWASRWLEALNRETVCKGSATARI